jgi:hypothetical protein
VTRGYSFRRRVASFVDEQALIRRYTRDGWTPAECGRRFSISTHLARTILVRNGIELRAARPAGPVDEDAVVGAYRKHRSLRYVAKVMRTSQQIVAAILDAHGEPHSTHTRPEIGTGLRGTPPAGPSAAGRTIVLGGAGRKP